MSAVAICYVFRTVLTKYIDGPIRHDENAFRVLMGASMVGMLVPRWRVGPDGVWGAFFGVAAIYFLTQRVRRRRSDADQASGRDARRVQSSHYLAHGTMAGAMVYLYSRATTMAAPSTGHMGLSSMPSRAGDPGFSVLLAVLVLASAVWQLDARGLRSSQRAANGPPRILPAPTPGPSPTTENADSGGFLSLRVDGVCDLAMGIATGYMLLVTV
jgi:hypothetical protein